MKWPRIEPGFIVFILIIAALVLLVANVDMHMLAPFSIGAVAVMLAIAREGRKQPPVEVELQREQVLQLPAVEEEPEIPIYTYSASTWHRENETIDILYTPKDFDAPMASVVLRNCTIGKMYVEFTMFEQLVIENCTIGEFHGQRADLENGCIIINSTFKDLFMLSEYGHNKEEVRIEGNEFFCFADFFDEVFEARFVFRNNILHQGSNLLAYDAKNFTPHLGNDPLVEGNTGSLYDEG